MKKASEHIDRFPSVQLVDLDLFLSDGVGTRGPNEQAMANCQVGLHKQQTRCKVWCIFHYQIIVHTPSLLQGVAAEV